jgi:predicted nucleic-acid-binding protein
MNKYLINANIIIRYLTQDDEKLFVKSKEIFDKIISNQIQVIIYDLVIMEAFFVLTKFYKLDKNEVIEALIEIILLPGVINSDKKIIIDTLNMVKDNNIDFVDTLLCNKSKQFDYKLISFDKKLNKIC